MASPAEAGSPISRFRLAIDQSFVARFALGILLFLAWFPPVAEPASRLLDPSYKQAYGFFLRHHLQAGVDYIFHLGPLGYFYSPVYDPDLYWIDFVFRAALVGVAAVIFMAFFSRLRGPIDRFLFYFALLFGVPFSHWQHAASPNDAFFLLLPVAVTLILIRNAGSGWMSTTGGLVVLTALSLMKFTYLLLGGVCVLAIAASEFRTGSARRAGAILAGFAGLFLLGWLICGQSLANLPAYISTSIEVSRGYNEAMIASAEPLAVILGFAAFVLAAVLILLGPATRPISFSSALGAAGLIAGLFLAWKAGFVRQMSHFHTFFVFAAGVPYLALAAADLRENRRTLASGLAACIFVLSVVGLFLGAERYSIWPGNFLGSWERALSRNIRALAHPIESKAEMDQALERLSSDNILPRIRERVGERPVDIFSYEQGVLLLNGLQWKPRPVFHSNATYSPSLMDANARFYESPQAPPFVIFKLEPIDGRFPSIEDAEALRVLLIKYSPLLIERGFLLLERRAGEPAQRSPAAQIPSARNIKFGESVTIENSGEAMTLLKLDIELSPIGKLVALLFKPPAVRMEVEATDGSRLIYRIPPGMARSGFIVNPYWRSQEDLLRWIEGGQFPSIKSIIVTAPSAQAKLFDPEIALTLALDPALSMTVWRIPAPSAPAPSPENHP